MPNPTTSYNFTGEHRVIELHILNYPPLEDGSSEEWAAQILLNGLVTETDSFSTELEALRYGVRAIAKTYSDTSEATLTRNEDGSVNGAFKSRGMILIEGQAWDPIDAWKGLAAQLVRFLDALHAAAAETSNDHDNTETTNNL